MNIFNSLMSCAELTIRCVQRFLRPFRFAGALRLIFCDTLPRRSVYPSASYEGGGGGWGRWAITHAI